MGKIGITDGIKIKISKLLSLDEFDLLWRDQGDYDLIAALSINENRLG